MNNTEPIKLDTAQIRVDAGKRLTSQPQTQRPAIVNLNEGAGIGHEYFTLNKKKGSNNKNKQSDDDV